MNDITNDQTAGLAPTPAPTQAAAPQAAADPLAIFATSAKESAGVTVDIEHPVTGEALMRFRLARFGGSNSSKVIRVERELKSKLTQGQRRAIDAGNGDPDIVQRMNRQTFVRTSVLGYEPVNPLVAEKWPAQEGAAAHTQVDRLLEAYPGVYDLLSELATSEEKYANAQVADAGNG